MRGRKLRNRYDEGKNIKLKEFPFGEESLVHAFAKVGKTTLTDLHKLAVVCGMVILTEELICEIEIANAIRPDKCYKTDPNICYDVERKEIREALSTIVKRMEKE